MIETCAIQQLKNQNLNYCLNERIKQLKKDDEKIFQHTNTLRYNNLLVKKRIKSLLDRINVIQGVPKCVFD